MTLGDSEPVGLALLLTLWPPLLRGITDDDDDVPRTLSLCLTVETPGGDIAVVGNL